MRLYRTRPVVGTRSAGTFHRGQYTFAVEDGQILYYTVSIVCDITSCPNTAGRQYPPLVLPLIAHWLRTLEELDFETFKASWCWTYIGLQNLAAMGIALGCLQTHRPRLQSTICPGWNLSVCGRLMTFLLLSVQVLQLL